MSKTAYDILNVSPTATEEEIKRQYHTLMRNIGTGSELSEIERAQNEAKMREYNSAYEKLSGGRRTAYDETLGLHSIQSISQESVKDWEDDSKWTYHEDLGPNGEIISSYWSFQGRGAYTSEEQMEIRQESLRREQLRIQNAAQQEGGLDDKQDQQTFEGSQVHDAPEESVGPKDWEDDSKWTYHEDLGPNGEKIGGHWSFAGRQTYTEQEQNEIVRESLRREQVRIQEAEQAKEEQSKKFWEERQKEFAKFEEQQAYFDNVARKQRELEKQLAVSNEQMGSLKKSGSRAGTAPMSKPVSDILDKLIESRMQELFDIINGNYKFCGSLISDPNQKLRQDYWNLKSEKEKLERDLRMAEQDARIEHMKKSPTNEVQLGIDSRNLFSSMSSLESQRNMELQGIKQNYWFKMNKRFMTSKKRQRLLQAQQQEEDKVNAKYNHLREQYEAKRVQIDMDLAAYQKAEKTAIENDPRVQEIKGKLEKAQIELNSLEEKLGYQTQTSSYQAGYGVKK